MYFSVKLKSHNGVIKEPHEAQTTLGREHRCPLVLSSLPAFHHQLTTWCNFLKEFIQLTLKWKRTLGHTNKRQLFSINVFNLKSFHFSYVCIKDVKVIDTGLVYFLRKHSSINHFLLNYRAVACRKKTLAWA